MFVGTPVGLVDEEDVRVRAVAQLVAAEPAQTDHRDTRWQLIAPGIPDGGTQRARQRRGGDVGHGVANHVDQRSRARGLLGQRRAVRGAVRKVGLEAAQRAGDVGRRSRAAR